MNRTSVARPVATLLMCASAGMRAAFGAEAHTPALGSSERKEIAIAIHGPCERDLKQDVMLKFDRLLVAGEWAFARVTPVQPNGEAIDYSATAFKEQVAAGMFDANGEALLHRTGDVWKIVEWRFGNTDTQLAEWLGKHHAPAALAH